MIIFTLISGIISGIAEVKDIPATTRSEINYSGEEWFVIFKFVGAIVLAIAALSLLITGITVIFTGIKTNKDKKLSGIIGGGMIIAAVIAAAAAVLIFSNAFDLEILDGIFSQLD